MSYVNSQRQKHLVLLNCSLIWCSPPYFFIRGSIVLGKNVLDGVSAKSWHVVTLPVLNNYFVLTSVFSNNYVHRCSYCISLCASFCKAHLVRALRTIFKVLTRVNRITSYVVTSEVLSQAHLVAARLRLTILLRFSVFWNNTSLLWSK